MAERAMPPVKGIRAKSVFQLTGAGAVGVGSLRGMATLDRLRAAGFAIWPFDPLRVPAAIEIYPRILSGEIVKSHPDACRRYLREHYGQLPPEVRERAAHPEDAFDAFVSALRMWAHVEDLLALPDVTSPVLKREGVIWYPGWSDDVRSERSTGRL